MKVEYRTNGAPTTPRRTEYYFGKTFMVRSLEAAKQLFIRTGEQVSRYWQEDTGYLTIALS